MIDPKVIADCYMCPIEADGKYMHGCIAIVRRSSKSKGAQRLGSGFTEVHQIESTHLTGDIFEYR